MHRNNTKPHRARRKPVVGDEWYEEADWDDAGAPGKDSGKIRQRIESLREARQLQQALRDTFDY